jgi:hypothetical protein
MTVITVRLQSRRLAMAVHGATSVQAIGELSRHVFIPEEI